MQIQQVANCDKLNDAILTLMSYMKLTVEDADVAENNILDWMAMVETGDYDDYEIEEDIVNNGSWSDTDLQHIKKSLRDLNTLMSDVLRDFESKTGVWIYFEYNQDDYEAYFDFNATKVLESLLELHKLITSVVG
jgi:hypothetical protein